MKKTMSDYINNMTKGDMETLENLICLQYKKFTRFYKLIKEYSGIISKVKYEFNSPLSLDVVLFFDTKRSLEKIKEELDASISKSDYEGTIEVIKKSLFVSIVLDENNTGK